MFTHLYTPEQVKEIGHEEINRREEEFELSSVITNKKNSINK